MASQVVWIVDKPRVAIQLLGDARVLVEVTIVEAGKLAARDISSSPHELVFAVDELPWIFRALFPYSRMIIQEVLEMWVLRKVLRIIDERRILIQLPVDARMVVQIFIEVIQLRPIDIMVIHLLRGS